MPDNKITSASKIELEVIVRFSEEEAAALYEMSRYNADDFLKVFYEKLGRSYLVPHEKGVRTLWEKLRTQMPVHLRKVKRAREAFSETE